MKDLHLQSAREDEYIGLANLRVHGMAESPSMIEYSSEVLAGLETDLQLIPNEPVVGTPRPSHWSFQRRIHGRPSLQILEIEDA
jgi:hypothetical protein